MKREEVLRNCHTECSFIEIVPLSMFHESKSLEGLISE